MTVAETPTLIVTIMINSLILAPLYTIISGAIAQL